ncbi:MAG: helix-turn-helix domain-containing protein [Deltaproteobacteria bacterium]|nr:helix-turn-helix domain-containing protein [Deltaproteobacteria bacterium]
MIHPPSSITKCNTEENTYKQLTADERDKIAIFMARGFNLNNIARMLGRNRSTISQYGL